MHAAEFPLLPDGQFGLLAVQFLPGAAIWDEPCQPVEFRHDQRVPFARGGEGQHYRMAVPTCSPPSSSTGIRQSRRSGQAAETRRVDSQAKAPSSYTAHLRIPVAKAPIAALAYNSAPYRSRPEDGELTFNVVAGMVVRGRRAPRILRKAEEILTIEEDECTHDKKHPPGERGLNLSPRTGINSTDTLSGAVAKCHPSLINWQKHRQVH